MRWIIAVFLLFFNYSNGVAAQHPYIYSKPDYTGFFVSHMSIRIMPLGRPYAYKPEEKITYFIRGMVNPVLDLRNYKPELKNYPSLTCGLYNEVILDGWQYITVIDRGNQGPCD